MGNILKIFIGEHPKQWDNALAHAEFAYNDSPNWNTRLSPFQMMYKMHWIGFYELKYLGKPKRSVEG